MLPESFAKLLHENDSVVILFVTGSRCAPCKAVAPFVEEQLKKIEGKCFKLDLDRDKDLCALLSRYRQFKAVPTLLAYEKGNVSIGASKALTSSSTQSIAAFLGEYIKR